MVTSDAPTEIGVVAYPNSQLAAIHGLTDLFLEASRIARELGGDAAHGLRVTHWRIARDGKSVECSFDTHGGRPALPAVLLAPPTLKGPPRAEALRPLALWLRERHAGGRHALFDLRRRLSARRNRIAARPPGDHALELR